uniref:Uncharacterized protein n=1 Tax=Arundo donax TaxID=35708 RepID=A0A0A9G3K0_ARUDO
MSSAPVTGLPDWDSGAATRICARINGLDLMRRKCLLLCVLVLRGSKQCPCLVAVVVNSNPSAVNLNLVVGLFMVICQTAQVRHWTWLAT